MTPRTSPGAGKSILGQVTVGVVPRNIFVDARTFMLEMRDGSVSNQVAVPEYEWREANCDESLSRDIEYPTRWRLSGKGLSWKTSGT